MMVGLMGNFIPAFLFTFAQTGLVSGYVGMLNSATPLFAVLIAFFIFKEELTQKHFIGLIIGIIGVVMLMNTYVGDQKFNGGFKHIAAVIFATFCYGLSLNVIKYRLKSLKAIQITSLAFLTIFLPGWFAFFWFDTPTVFVENPLAWNGIFYILMLSLLGTVLGVFLYAILIARTKPIFSSMVTFAMPIVSLGIGTLDGEKIEWIQLLGLIVICAGIFVANKRFTKVKRAPH
jgi:drug/metabolite transporter (DMT)-like permease